MLRVVVDGEASRAEFAGGLDEIVREGARRMLVAALETEVAAYLAALADQVDERGRRLVVRNGHARPRPVTTGAGAIEVAAPRINDKRVDPATGQRVRFRSVILPAARSISSRTTPTWLPTGTPVAGRNCTTAGAESGSGSSPMASNSALVPTR
jgi:hypothetical protein